MPCWLLRQLLKLSLRQAMEWIEVNIGDGKKGIGVRKIDRETCPKKQVKHQATVKPNRNAFIAKPLKNGL
jgi:hypothetical protein